MTGSSLDTNLDSGFGGWKAINFARKSGKALYNLPSDGPDRDHTSEIEGTSQGKNQG